MVEIYLLYLYIYIFFTHISFYIFTVISVTIKKHYIFIPVLLIYLCIHFFIYSVTLTKQLVNIFLNSIHCPYFHLHYIFVLISFICFLTYLFCNLKKQLFHLSCFFVIQSCFIFTFISFTIKVTYLYLFHLFICLFTYLFCNIIKHQFHLFYLFFIQSAVFYFHFHLVFYKKVAYLYLFHLFIRLLTYLFIL